MIEHKSGASGGHFASSKDNRLENEANSEGSRMKRWRKFLII